VEINVTAVLGFVISVLTVPLIIYVWKDNRSDIKDMKASIGKNTNRITQCEIDAQETKTNYTQKFSDLQNHISMKFEQSSLVQSDIKVSIKEIETILKLLVENKNQRN